jgi:hypothetical protein
MRAGEVPPGAGGWASRDDRGEVEELRCRMTLQDLLERGYFPKELPPPFTSAGFAVAVCAPNATLPAELQPDLTVWRPGVREGRCVRYSHARGGLARRALSIPNPLHQLLLSKEMHTFWQADILPKVAGTTLSASNPVWSVDGRAIQGAQGQSARAHLAVSTRVNARYLLRADISRFYQSIYTHSIPWALHGKNFAKANRGNAHLGNRLDYLSRQQQDGQTMGIPIGPDTSLVLAELLMHRVDEAMKSRISGVKGFRFIDDYELAFRTRSEAEDAYHILNDELAVFELALNPLKSVVIELPTELEARWVAPIRDFRFRDSVRGQATDLYRYFDLVLELAKLHPGRAVDQYAVARTAGLVVHPENWELYQRLLLVMVAPQPAVLMGVLREIITRTNGGATPLKDEIGEVLNAVISEHAAIGHSSELAWALWGCLVLDIPLTQDAGGALARCNDPVAALLALHLNAVGLVAAPLSTAQWETKMTADGLWDEHWILAYEANVHGWLPPSAGHDHVAADPVFGYLKRQGVRFYDQALARPQAGGIPVPPLAAPPTADHVSEP